MATSFAPIMNNVFTRKWGTTPGQTIDPYITGYQCVWFSYIPNAIVEIIGEASFSTNSSLGDGIGSSLTKDGIQKVLSGTCLSVTTPTRTVNKAEMQGLGGIKWSAVTNIDEDNTISMRFLEIDGLPLYRIFHGWTQAMRDNRTGVSLLNGSNAGAGGNVYSKANYAGTVYYWTMRPSVGRNDIQFAACYSGIFPMKTPTDMYGHDLASIDKLEIDMDFSLDYQWLDPWVYSKAAEIQSKYMNQGYNAAEATAGDQTHGAIRRYSDGLFPV